MRIVIQRVKEASVEVNKKEVGKINKGLLVFFGAKKEDTEEQISWLVTKIINLRIFSDVNGKMNLSLKDIQGEILVVSQFTLYADCTMGRRPSFIKAAEPAYAEKLYERFIKEMKKEIAKVETGIFAAKMEVKLINDGPVTFIIDAKKAI